MIKQRNNHARRNQKRFLLKMKNFWQRVFENRAAKKAKAVEKKYRTKDTTIRGRARDYAMHVNYKAHRHVKFSSQLNQRQRRKKWAANPHLRKRAV